MALPAIAPSDALVVFDELPLPAELAGVLEELLLKDELPVLVAVPFAPAAAKFRVPFEADVLLLALLFFLFLFLFLFLFEFRFPCAFSL